MGRPAKPFWSYVQINNPFLCWEWLGGKCSDGYGSCSGGNGAHRRSYELVIGNIPDNLELDHLCRNRSCVNPYHLEAVTHKVNTQRGLTKTVCKRGHPRTPENLTRNRCRECMRTHNSNFNKEYNQRPEVKARHAARERQRRATLRGKGIDF